MTEPLDPAGEVERLRALASRYPEVDASATERAANRYAVERAIEHVCGSEVLVLGAAVGAWAEPLLERFGHFSIVDAVAECVDAIARRHPGAVHGHTALFEQFEAPCHYDSLVLGHVLEHVLDPVSLLVRARSWLRPPGRAVILVPNALSLHRLVGVQLGLLPSLTTLAPSDQLLGHRRVYTPALLRTDLARAGWDCTLLTGLALKPLSNAQMDAWEEPLRQAFFALGDRFPEHACMLLAVATPAQR